MRDSCYLILAKSGVRRMTKSLPKLDGGELAVRLRVEVPESHFRNPHADVALVIDERHIFTPEITLLPSPEG